MTDFDKELILAFAKNDMKVVPTAEELFCHKNTVDYHIIKIKEKYNLNPKSFYDLVELVKIVKGGVE